MDRHRPALTRRWALLAAALPVTFLSLFFLWPLANILALGLAPEGQLQLGHVLETWARPWVLDTVVFTLALAGLSTLLTLLLGLPAAWVFARFTFPGKRVARALTVVPFVLPTVVVGSAFLALLGPRSPLNELLGALFGEAFPQVRLDGSVAAILIAHVFYNIAVVIRLVGGMWAHIDPRTEEAARMLGASGWTAFREVTWPLLRTAVASAASIVFLFTVTSFGVVLLLGGPRDATLEVEIYRQTAVLLDLPTAAALTILQMIGVLGLLLASARAQEGLAVQQRLRGSGETARRPRRGRERLLVGAILVATVLFMFVPLAVLLERSLQWGNGYGLGAYASLIEADPRLRLSAAPWQSVIDSLAFAAATTLIAGSLGLLAAVVVGYRRGWFSRGLDALVMLPLGTSAVIVGFGFLVALDTPPLDLRTSILLIPIAHSLIALPFVMRSAVPVIRSIDDRLREAAAVLGASPRRTWREVDGPILARGALVGAGFAFAVSLGEFGATLFIARPDTVTIPVAIYRLLGQPGAASFATAMALAIVLMVLTASAVLLIERLRGSGPQP
ncbi:MAG: iron ABC transporter permease, partial [Candidatus Limnocylindrales bacterium]